MTRPLPFLCVLRDNEAIETCSCEVPNFHCDTSASGWMKTHKHEVQRPILLVKLKIANFWVKYTNYDQMTELTILA